MCIDKEIESEENYYCFRTDGDCHHYLIKVEDIDLFNYLLELGEKEEHQLYTEFNDRFEKDRINNLFSIKFKSPEEM